MTDNPLMLTSIVHTLHVQREPELNTFKVVLLIDGVETEVMFIKAVSHMEAGKILCSFSSLASFSLSQGSTLLRSPITVLNCEGDSLQRPASVFSPGV
jgi:hypothetical protein